MIEDATMPSSKAPTAKASGGTASPEVDAAGDILAAIKANDAKALSLALKRSYEACASGDHDDQED